MLQIDGLTKRYRDRAVLHALSLSVGSGEYVAIVGESGSGKSTLLNLIAGLDRPDAGSDRDRRQSTSHSSTTPHARCCVASKLGFVFQAFHILPHLTVAQNVALPLVLLGVAPDAARHGAPPSCSREVGLAGRESEHAA